MDLNSWKKKDIKAKAKSILNGSKLIGKEDKIFLNELFKKHYQYDLKRGAGIEDILIKKTYYGTNGFYIKRIDGTETDISYLVCMNGKSKKIDDIIKACRTVVYSEVAKVKNTVNYGVDRCQFTNEVLYPYNTHIDHYKSTFKVMFDSWVKSKDVNYLYSKINNTNEDNVIDIYFEDDTIADEFLRYHNENTNLRAISKKANLSLLKRKK